MITRDQIQKALQDPEQLHETFKWAGDITHAAIKNPDQAMTLILYLFDHQDEFDRLVKDRSDLIFLAEELPHFAEVLIQFVLNHDDEFKRLFKTNTDLEKACKQYPHHAVIFGKQTVEAAYDALKHLDTCAVRQSMMLLLLCRNRKESNLEILPPEILLEIAEYVRYTDNPAFNDMKKMV